MANSADSDQKPTELDLDCLQRQGKFGFSMTRVKMSDAKLRGWKQYFCFAEEDIIVLISSP